jgi:hypothetical protein
MTTYKKSLIAFTFLVICTLLTGCVGNRGKSFNGIQANFPKDSTNGVAKVSVDTNGVMTAEVTGAESVEIGGGGRVNLNSLFATTALKGASHTRNDMLGGNVKTTASAIDGDPDADALKAAGSAGGELVNAVVKP